MPVNERALLRQMREGFKGAGYRCGTVMNGGVEWLMMNGMSWAVATPYREASKDLKAAIVLHTGEMPGKAVKAQKDAVQLELDGELEKTYCHIFQTTSDMLPCRKTCMSLGELEIWQDSSGRCNLFSPELTGLILPMDEDPLERITDGRRMLLTDGETKVFALAKTPPENRQELLDYLAQKDWADVVEEEAQ